MKSNIWTFFLLKIEIQIVESQIGSGLNANLFRTLCQMSYVFAQRNSTLKFEAEIKYVYLIGIAIRASRIENVNTILGNEWYSDHVVVFSYRTIGDLM